MTPVTQMPMYGNSQPFAAYFGSSEGTPEGGSAGGGKRRGTAVKKTTAKTVGGKATKKSGRKTK